MASARQTDSRKLERIARDARESYGPRSARWPERARLAKLELARRGYGS